MCGTATPLPLARSLFLFLSPPPPPPRLGRKLPHTMPPPILNTSHSPTVLGSLAGPANGYRFHTGHKRELMDWPSLTVRSYLSAKVLSFAHNVWPHVTASGLQGRPDSFLVDPFSCRGRYPSQIRASTECYPRDGSCPPLHTRAATSACGFGVQEREAWLYARLTYASP
ncbi:hypothetical protein COCC4DRAFT_22699 [Bipolaris maydis ATCC 48331]|uniref:Uncharacterized protein n=1 Tax=Cochliobolus heterostrophus (strain C4 / ATCC 48331 / race T) TaxID=665024 RepID=N4XIS8_COCH4|nr:uncharacterized protein COCC4DRAFT_22699 [Bipolaris maydis ATCC 48331]ENI06436.1 hypothetical protein COCC4DRAFT_22699 [Bipolaris maydis ATCC 48331]KAJ5029863.1 hypothetical protein J3E73DRAFT_253003 [Bipolaris maydis]KAJ6275293.1 hypothetical protein PSV08DRAFT_244327 [Bipolaris maydis]KAJ6285414.1 hypothetical protein J3E71DRAFT_236317 [Bipolaris maydis]